MLIEIFVDGSGSNRHFHNMAFWYGRRYRGFTPAGDNLADELLEIVTKAVTGTNLTLY